MRPLSLLSTWRALASRSPKAWRVWGSPSTAHSTSTSTSMVSAAHQATTYVLFDTFANISTVIPRSLSPVLWLELVSTTATVSSTVHPNATSISFNVSRTHWPALWLALAEPSLSRLYWPVYIGCRSRTEFNTRSLCWHTRSWQTISRNISPTLSTTTSLRDNCVRRRTDSFIVQPLELFLGAGHSAFLPQKFGTVYLMTWLTTN